MDNIVNEFFVLIFQVINERLSMAYTQKTLRNISTVLSCCSGILSTAPLSIVYTAKSEFLVDLLSKLSQLACWQLSLDDPVSSQLFEVLQLTLGQYLLVQRQQANANRVFGQVTKHLLQPCLLLRHLLTARVWTPADDVCVRQHLSREIRTNVENLLRAGVFQLELLLAYREELLSEKDSHIKKKGALKNLLLPASTIQSVLGDAIFCQPGLHGKVVVNSVPLLFRLFLDSYNKAENHLVCFHMLTRLFGCLRISCVQGNLWNNELSPSEWSTELLAVEQLLNSVLSSGIYNVAADRIRHKEVQFSFYQQLSQMLVNHPQATIPAWFRCFKALISLNHLIVEPDLNGLVASAWIDAGVPEVRTKKAQEALINSLFQTYAKLRQFHKLFEEVVSVICRPAAEGSRLLTLPVGLRTKLCEYLLDLPHNQVLDILSIIVEKCRTSIIPDVKNNSGMASKLQSMIALLHSVLFNMRSLDDSTPLPVVRRTQRLLESMQREIIQVLLDLLKDCQAENMELEFWVEKTSDSALLLVCTWVAADTLFSLNCCEYASPLAKTDSPVTCWDFSDLLHGLEAKCWEKITKLLSSSCSGSRYSMEWLVLQKMKTRLIHTSTMAEASCPILQSSAAFILHSGSSFKNGEEPEAWDGNVGTINRLTYPTAHWQLVVSNLPVLVPYLSMGDILHVAGVFLKTLLVTKAHVVPTEDDDDDSLITVQKVSRDLLHSPLLPEMKVLHSSFISHIVQHCAGVLSLTVQNVADQPLQQLAADEMPWGKFISSGCVTSMEPTDESSVCWTVLEKVAQNILCLAKTKSHVTLEEEHIQRLLELLEIISVLHLDSLFPLDHTRVFLLLLSLVVNTRVNAACAQTLSLKFQATCFHLLAYLQTGRNVNSSFKVLHASDVLEVVLTSMIVVCKSFTNISTVVPWDEFFQEIQIFLEHYLQITLDRRQSVKLNMDKYMSFLGACQSYAANDKHSENWGSAADQLLLVAQTALCHVLTLHLQQQRGQWHTSDILSTLLDQAVRQTGTTLRLCLRNRPKGQPLPVAFIPCITTLLKADSTCLHPVDRVTEGSEQIRQLSHSELYIRFYSQILRELGLAGSSVQFLHSALQFLAVFCSVPNVYPVQETSLAVFHSVKKLLAGMELFFSSTPELTLEVWWWVTTV